MFLSLAYELFRLIIRRRFYLFLLLHAYDLDRLLVLVLFAQWRLVVHQPFTLLLLFCRMFLLYWVPVLRIARLPRRAAAVSRLCFLRDLFEVVGL